MARPRGGDWLEDEIRSLKDSKVDLVVSLLTKPEIVELDLLEEELLCRSNQIGFMNFPIIDRDVPALDRKTYSLVKELSDNLSRGQSIAIHCRMGIGRSSLIAASVLAIQGISVNEAFKCIETSRGCSVPDTVEQRDWVGKFATRFIGE